MKSKNKNFSDLNSSSSFDSFFDSSEDEIEEINSQNNNQIIKPRSYQIAAFEFAKKNNSLVFIQTGAGKTLIAKMLIEDTIKNRSNPKKKIFFIVNTNVLLEQQYNVLSADIKGVFLIKSGRKGLKKKENWEEIYKQNDVFVVIDDIFLKNLRKGYIKMDDIELIVLDECHHTTSDHKYNFIIKEFYLENFLDNMLGYKPKQIPKILGLTASPLKKKIIKQNVLIIIYRK